MDAYRVESRADDSRNNGWIAMLVLSLVLHSGVFSAIFLVPNSFPSRRITGPVYEVNLVEMPVRKDPVKAAPTAPGRTVVRTSSPVVKDTTPAKRIAAPKPEDTPVVVAKRIVEKKPEKPAIAPTKLIDKAVARVEKSIKPRKKDAARLINEAVARIERKVDEEKQQEDHIGSAIAKLETTQPSAPVEGPAGAAAGTAIRIRLYQMKVEDRIKGNWTYPAALDGSNGSKTLEAIVLVLVKSDGSIEDYSLKTPSKNPLFDQSALKAVERSNPLPPFPEGYRKTSDEIEIKFNLKDLEET